MRAPTNLAEPFVSGKLFIKFLMPRTVAPTALNFGVLKSISVTKTYGGSFEYLVSRIRNGVEHNDENDRENDGGNAGQYEWLHDDGRTRFGSYIRLYSFFISRPA